MYVIRNMFVGYHCVELALQCFKYPAGTRIYK